MATTTSPVSIADDLTGPSKRSVWSQIPDGRAKNRVLPIELLSSSEQNSTPVAQVTGVIKEPPATLEPEGDCGSKSEAQSEDCPGCNSVSLTSQFYLVTSLAFVIRDSMSTIILFMPSDAFATYFNCVTVWGIFLAYVGYAILWADLLKTNVPYYTGLTLYTLGYLTFAVYFTLHWAILANSQAVAAVNATNLGTASTGVGGSLADTLTPVTIYLAFAGSVLFTVGSFFYVAALRVFAPCPAHDPQTDCLGNMCGTQQSSWWGAMFFLGGSLQFLGASAIDAFGDGRDELAAASLGCYQGGMILFVVGRVYFMASSIVTAATDIVNVALKNRASSATIPAKSCTPDTAKTVERSFA